ncbi:MAG: hypothetical protein V4582_17655 [Pseudomonadota bacterium]
MTLRSFLSCCAILLPLAAGNAHAQAPRGETAWLSYRDAYRSMLWFEKYGKPKQFIQNHFQAVAREPGATLEGLHLTLVSKTSQLELPLDALGRTVLPLLKAAYDDNAEITLNRKPGQYQFRARASIVGRADGVYEAADLRAACAQLLAYQRYVDPAAERGRACVGVRFSFARKDVTANVRFKMLDGSASVLAAAEGPAFADDAAGVFRIVNYRFADWPDKGFLVTQSPPLAITALYE